LFWSSVLVLDRRSAVLVLDELDEGPNRLLSTSQSASTSLPLN
jgi:hypothetical protein